MDKNDKQKTHFTNNPQVTSFKKRIINFKRSTKYQLPIELINFFFSLCCIFLYIIMTYHPGKMLNSSLFFYCNFVCRVFFLFDFLCELFVMFNLQTYDISCIIIEIFSLIPFMVMRFIVGMKILFRGSYLV